MPCHVTFSQMTHHQFYKFIIVLTSVSRSSQRQLMSPSQDCALPLVSMFSVSHQLTNQNCQCCGEEFWEGMHFCGRRDGTLIVSWQVSWEHLLCLLYMYDIVCQFQRARIQLKILRPCYKKMYIHWKLRLEHYPSTSISLKQSFKLKDFRHHSFSFNHFFRITEEITICTVNNHCISKFLYQHHPFITSLSQSQYLS